MKTYFSLFTKHTRKITKTILCLLFVIISYVGFSQIYEIEEISVLTEQETGIYDRFELGIKFSSDLESVINLEYAEYGNSINTDGFNPFDPDHISLEVIFWPETAQGSEDDININGFFYKEFIRDFDSLSPYPPLVYNQPWQEITSNPYNWRVRFAPTKLGTWNYTVKVIIAGTVNETTGEIEGPSITYTYPETLQLECISSRNLGPLELSPNGKYLQYEKDKTSFLGIALSIPEGGFPHGMYEYDSSNNGRLETANTDMEKYLSTFSNNGGNLVKIHMDAPGYQLEHEILGNYNSRMPVAWELDQIVDRARDLNLYLILTAQMHHSFMYDYRYPCTWSAKWGLFGWEKNPYNNIMININDNAKDEFFTSGIAIKFFKNRLRYTIARWGYSNNLAGVEVATEMNHFLKYCDTSDTTWIYAIDKDFLGDSLDEVNMRKNIRAWLGEMLVYADSVNENHQLLFSGSNGGLGDYTSLNLEEHIYGLDNIDFIGLHHYSNGQMTHIKRFEFSNYFQTEKDLPVIYMEMGTRAVLDTTNDELHKAVWTTGLGGSFATGFNYYWYDILDDPTEIRQNNFNTFATFMKDVPLNKQGFTSYILRDFTDNETIKLHEFDNNDSEIEQFHLLSDDKKYLLGFVHAASAYWDYDSTAIEHPMTQLDNHPITIPLLLANRHYKIEVFDTHGYDSDSLQLLDTYQQTTSSEGTLSFQLTFEGNYKCFAYKISDGCNWNWSGLNNAATNVAGDLLYASGQIFYRTNNSTINSIIFSEGKWDPYDLNDIAIDVESDLVGNNSQIFYITSTGTINSIYKLNEEWHHSELNNAATNVIGDLLYTPGQVFYRAGNGKINSIIYSYSNNTWHHSELNDAAKDVESDLVGDDSQIFYKTSMGTINSIYKLNEKWYLSELNNAATIVAGDLLYTTGQVFYITTNSTISSIIYSYSNDIWYLSDLNNAITDVESSLVGNDSQIFYKSSTGNIYSVYKINDTWNWSSLGYTSNNVGGSMVYSPGQVFYSTEVGAYINSIYYYCPSTQSLKYGNEGLASSEKDNQINSNNSHIQLYPNPASSEIYFSNLPDNIEISIYSLDGIISRKTKLNKNKLRVDNIPNGIYILRFTINSSVITKKLVVTH